VSSEPYDRLSALSRANFYNAFEAFDWPPSLPLEQPWMSFELLTVAGTPYAERLSRPQLVRLSHCESIHFYTLLMYGERDLVRVVLEHIHGRGYEDLSEYFHHFIEEENKHMWFFSQFCRRYGEKSYPDRSLKFAEFQGGIAVFVAFAKILIFEEIGDFFNVRMRDDEALPPIVRQLNALHHQDESRHLAMGRSLLVSHHERLKAEHAPAELRALEHYLKRYMQSILESLYNPAVYRDAGLEDPYGLRRALCQHPGRRAFHETVLRRVMKFFAGKGIFETEELSHDAAGR